jgi:leader peptidase (prepilin peptidase) / N-methyltransferase
MSWSLSAAAVLAAVSALGGGAVPALIRRIPEPQPQPAEGPSGQAPVRADSEKDVEVPPLQPATTEPAPVGSADDEPKELYVDMARRPGLGWRSALAAALVGGALGARLGWSPALLLAGYLVPVGVALSVVDWRTRLLPTRVIAPSYAVVIVLAVTAAALGGDWEDLARAGWGWLVAGGLFLLMWIVYPAGMGYGDVRLSGILGIALGYVGWAELFSGLFAAFLLGGLGGALLSALRIVDRRSYPFGPFMLLGAVVGVLVGPAVAAMYVVP